MFNTMLAAMMILTCTSLAAAQSDDYKKFEIFGGYSYQLIGNDLDDDDVILDPESFRGFNASITGNVSRYFGLKFDFSGHFKSRPITFGPVVNGIDVDSSRYTYLGGVQFKNNSSEATFKPFVHALVGAAHVRNRVKINDNFCIAIAPTPCPGDFTEKDTGLRRHSEAASTYAQAIGSISAFSRSTTYQRDCLMAGSRPLGLE